MKALIINCSPVKNGATAALAEMAVQALSRRFEARSVCIADFPMAFCRGCRSCHTTGQCVQQDGVQELMAQMEAADLIFCVSPSYWADVPGQFKVFIDRCTPWCNTHEPHASLSGGKKGYAIALRTGPNVAECERIIGTLKHFYGHLEIPMTDFLCLTGVESKTDLSRYQQELARFFETL